MPEIRLDADDPTALLEAVNQLRQRAEEGNVVVNDTRNQATQLMQQAEQIARTVDADLALANALEMRARALRGEPARDGGRDRADSDDAEEQGPSVERVIAVLERIGGPAPISELQEALPDLKRKTVGWAAWKAEDDGRVRRINNGVYAPLSYEPVELIPHQEGEP